MAALIILVNADPRVLRHTEAVLSGHGYLVAAFQSVEEARDTVDSMLPDLIIADLRLGAGNGLELAIRSRFRHPDVPVIITHAWEDQFAAADAKYHGAMFIAAPLDNRRFVPCVHAAVERRQRARPPVRRWSRERASGVVKVIAADHSAQVIDLSNAGVRLHFGQTQAVIPETFTIALPAVIVQARRVWTGRAESGSQLCCGAQLVAASEHPWRQFVSSLRPPPA